MRSNANTYGLSSLVVLLVSVLFQTHSFAQDEHVREILGDRVNQGDLSPKVIDKIREFIDDQDQERVDLFAIDWEMGFLPEDINVVDLLAITFSPAGVDITGNLVFTTDFVINGGRGFAISKFDNLGSEIWQRQEITNVPLRTKLESTAIDIDGNVYPFFSVRDNNLPGENRMFLRKYSNGGDTNWTTEISTPGQFTNDPVVQVDQDGNIFVVTRVGSSFTAYRLNPSGVILWETTFGLASDFLGFEIDRFGDLHVLYSRLEDQNAIILQKITADGIPLWSRQILSDLAQGSLGNYNVSGPFLDKECNTFFAYPKSNSWIVSATDANGIGYFNTEISSSEPANVESSYPHIALSPDGLVYFAATQNLDSNLLLAQIDQNGTVTDSTNLDLPSPYTSFFRSSISLATDRFGNPYLSVVLSEQENGGGIQLSVGSFIYKFNRLALNDPPVWETQGISVNSEVRFQKIITDFGDNVYYAGSTQVINNLDSLVGLLGKISQPFTDVPTIAENAVKLQVEDRGLWYIDGVGEIPSVSYETTFFELSPDIANISLGFGETFDVPAVGEFGGSVNFGGSIGFKTGFRAYATGGKYDISYPGSMDIAIPGAAKRVAGNPFPIVIQFDPDPSAHLVSDGEPGAGAHVTAETSISATAGYQILAASETLASDTLFNFNIPPTGGDVPGLGFDLPTGYPGSWFDFGDEANLISGRAKRPQFSSSGGINLANGNIVSSLEPQVFFSLRGNLTNYITTYSFGTPTIFAIGAPGQQSSAWSIGANINIAQAFAEIELEANQTLEFVPDISIELDFNHPVTIDGAANQTTKTVTMTKEGSTWTGTIMVTVDKLNLPPNNALTMTPRADLDGSFSNRTWIDIQPKVGWETLQAGASATAIGFDLFEFDACLFCLDIPLADDIPLDLYDDGYFLDEEQVVLDPITMMINPEGKPRIGGLSRVDLKTFIYDQVDANPFDLAGFLNQPAKKMLVYGDNLTNENFDGFVICNNGRIQDMPTTVLNSRTAVVEIPNEMRLVPGVARIWAVNSIDQVISETADFPIVLPKPNLGTVGPNLWAADPRIADIAMDAIDGLTPAGTPSFIARRDYWYVLADMWNSVTGSSGLAFFDEFPNYNFEAEAPIPAVLIERDELSVASGRTHGWDFEGDFLDTVGGVDIVDANPGPTPPFVTEGLPSFLGSAVQLTGNRLKVGSDQFTPIGTDDFSIGFWAKRNSFSSSFRLVLDGNGSNGTRGVGFAVYFFDDGPGFAMFDDGPDASTFRSNSPVKIQDNEWHHYLFVADRDQSNGARWYIDGEFASSHDITSRQGFVGISPLDYEFGAQNEGGQSTLDGEIADFTIYNRVLDSDERMRISNPVEMSPMPRFIQPVENGILYSLMPVSEYDKSGFINISLLSPGPGGGLSNSVDLTVAAPRPKLQTISQTQVLPGSESFTLTLQGPLTVPYFDGIEQERFGNFNKSSVVMWDNHELKTKYINPGLLNAEVPEDLVALPGIGHVSVFTPSNGTQYFDEYEGEFFLSGGESNAITIDVRFPTPVIERLSPETTTVALLDRCLDNPQSLKISINGSDFQPGSKIWFDGIELNTFTQTDFLPLKNFRNGVENADLTDNVLYAYLEISDLSTIYEAPIVVLNPDGQASQPVYLNIVDQTTYEALFNTKLPEQQESCP